MKQYHRIALKEHGLLISDRQNYDGKMNNFDQDPADLLSKWKDETPRLR